MSRKLKELSATRKRRVRFKVKKNAGGKFRLTVFRSNTHVYAQVINDVEGVTIASASTLERKEFSDIGNKSNIQNSRKIGELIAQRSKKHGVEKVVFDRGACLYHGCIAALAESAREAGLKF